MPLSKILSSEEGGRLLLFTDTLHHPALPLLRAGLSALVDTFDSIHVFIFEERRDRFIAGLTPRVLARIKLHDFTLDPFGWRGDGEGTHIRELPAWPAASDNERCAVMLDSLTPLLHHWSAQRVCQWLHRLTMSSSSSPANQNTRQVTAVLHRDLHDRGTECMLSHTATTLISLHAVRDHTIAHNPSRTAAAHEPTCTVFRRVSGRQPKTSHETYTIDDDLSVRSAEVATMPFAQLSQQTKRTANPADNLTFSVTVSEKEGVARSKVKLPYVQTSETLKHAGGAGDSLDDENFNEDDFEEDPDDDLDI